MSETINVGLVGYKFMGRAHSHAYLAVSKFFDSKLTPVMKAVCGRDEPAVRAFAEKWGWESVETDWRKLVERDDIALVDIGTPGSTHAEIAIAAAKAGKHVYCEKPCCHNPAEGEMMVAAARHHRRAVTMGTQRRSSPLFQDAIQRVQNGDLGEVRHSRSWYNNRRGSIGKGKQVAAPDNLDFALWQGPAPRHPYQDNLVHYNW
ncbi:MAG: Gfo/Idh/MocA family oxidoreductase, partial [Planctomycetales bacterium]|nr:Gfo/Idh/MocA family oxidoreductase [Planctomycetales bacterium]